MGLKKFLLFFKQEQLSLVLPLMCRLFPSFFGRKEWVGEDPRKPHAETDGLLQKAVHWLLTEHRWHKVKISLLSDDQEAEV